MKADFENLLNKVANLDSWDIGAVLGGVNYLIRQAAVNAVVRRLPDPPEEGSGIEQFTKWEAQMRNPEIRQAVAPMVSFAERTCEVLEEYSTAPIATYESVLEFMTSRPPVKATFEAEYNARKRAGMKPGMSMKQFVDMEYQVALQRHNVLVAKGEDAIKVLNAIEPEDQLTGELPEWMYEAIHLKAIQKLQQRWLRAELRRTNPRITKEMRDLAEANQKMIEGVITELGGEIPTDPEKVENETSEDLDAFIEKVEKLALAQGGEKKSS